MIQIAVQKKSQGNEQLDPTGIERTRAALQQVKAVVIDLDKCLIRSYAGIPAFRELLRAGEVRWIDLISYFRLVIWLKFSTSPLGRLLPPRWRLDPVRFQEKSLIFELRTDEAILKGAVERSLSTLLSQVRQPLYQLCRMAEAQGAEVILATANSATFAEPLARELGIPTVLASRLDRKTGRPAALLVGTGKKAAVLRHLQGHGIPIAQSWFITDLDDGGHDRPLIEAFDERVSLVVNKS